MHLPHSPILADPEGHIIAGHGRLQAARALGFAEVPTITLFLSETQKRALRIADNKIALNAGAEARVASQGRQIISAEAHVLGPDRNLLAYGTTTVPVLGRCQTRALRLKRVHQPARRPYSRRSALAFAELKRECEDRRVAQERRRFRTLHPTLRNVSVSFYNCHLSNFGGRYPSHKT